MAKELLINAEADGNTAVIKIKGRISNWRNSSDDFEQTVDNLIARGIVNATVNINTMGGSTFEAFEIVNIIKKFPGTIKAELGSVCASSGTIISSSLYCTAATNTMFMVHRPILSIQGNEDEIESGVQLLKNVQKKALELYIKKTGKTAAEIEAKWKNDWWMTAEEAKDFGFVNEVEGEAELDPEAFAELEPEMIAKMPAQIAASLFPNNPKPETKIPEMDKVEMTALAVAVGMNATSKKDEVMAQVSANAQKAKLYDSLIEDTKSKTKNQIEAAIDAEVSAAKESKLITDSQVEMYKGIGVASGVETLKEVFAGMTPVVKLSAKVAPKGKGADNSDDPTAEWSYEDFQDKDPQALGKMHTEDAERFERLHKARK